MYNGWLVKFDIFYPLTIPFVISSAISMTLCGYGAQQIYMGYYVYEGIWMVALGIIFIALTVFIAALAFSLRTLYTRSGITRVLFNKSRTYKWKNLVAVHLVSTRGGDYFYFCMEKISPEALLMTKMRRNVIKAVADAESKRIVSRYYRRPIRHFRTVRKVNGRPKKIVGGGQIKVKKVQGFRALILSLALTLCVVVLIVLSFVLPSALTLALWFGIVLLIPLFIRLSILTFVFNDNGCYVKSLFVRSSINKYEIKGFGIYTDKDAKGSAKKKYLFISKFNSTLSNVQYNVAHKNTLRHFIKIDFDEDIFELVKTLTPLEPLRCAKVFY